MFDDVARLPGVRSGTRRDKRHFVMGLGRTPGAEQAAYGVRTGQRNEPYPMGQRECAIHTQPRRSGGKEVANGDDI